MSMIEVENKQQETFLFNLIDEYASKVLTSRRAEQKFKKYFGVVDVYDNDCESYKIYDVAFPEHYAKFIEYLLKKEHPQE